MKMRLLIFAFLTSALLMAQPEKYIDSVKISPDRGGCLQVQAACTNPGAFGGSEFKATNVSLEVLVEMAYDVKDREIEHADRLSGNLYDVSIKPETSGSVSYERLQPMLRTLLAERFHLQIHRETKQEAGYALLVAKSGPELRESEANARPGGIIDVGLIRDPRATLDEVAALLSHPLGKPVVNQTGIAGTFNVNLRFAPEGSEISQSGTPRPSIFTAVQEQLGLRLEPQKITTDILVIDHCERIPTEN
jgi:uncharacterized protein (TIGR03435 family)